MFAAQDLHDDPPVNRGSIGLTAIDLFCGAGGFTSGFLDEGYDVVLGLDNDRDCCDTYEANFGATTKVMHRSILDIEPKDLVDVAGKVDVVLGGPSCQPFSTHGRGTGWVEGDDRSNLWSHMHTIVRTLEPRAFVMENVPGLLYYDKGNFAADVFAAFENLGFRVHPEILLTADYSVPQLRRRVFVVGVADDLEFAFPDPPRLGGWRRDTLQLWERRRKQRGLLPHVTLEEALHDLPEPATALDAEVDYARRARRSSLARYLRRANGHVRDHVASPIPEELLPLIAHVPPGGTWRDIPPYLLPDRFRRMRRTDGTNLLGRLVLDRPSYTVTTQFNNATTGCFLHPRSDRVLSVREGARLQTFRDDHVFEGALSSRYRQVGNAVPPLMARVIAARLADVIKGRPTKPAPLEGSRSSRIPHASSEATAKRMMSQRRHDTAPEILVRKALFRRGYRYRKEYPVPGLERRTIDVAMPGRRAAIFVHGCFWHGCPEHSKPTKSNTKWWAEKIARNRERDAETVDHLESEGWAVIVIWEHENPEDAADRVHAQLRGSGPRAE